jgi:hypothetical protein
MSSQEVLIEVQIIKHFPEPKKAEMIIADTVKARNRVKSTILVQQSVRSQESFQMMVTPYFGPITEDVAVK